MTTIRYIIEEYPHGCILDAKKYRMHYKNRRKEKQTKILITFKGPTRIKNRSVLEEGCNTDDIGTILLRITGIERVDKW